MVTWTAFPHRGEYAFDAVNLRQHWARLHAGDVEPLPADAQVLQAWVLFHNGDFEQAAEAGLRAGGHGVTVANKATCIYATYLEKKEKSRLDLFQEVARRAGQQAEEQPDNPNAHFWQAYALGRYSQGISVARALAQGIGGKVKDALEKAIRLQPRHADAHVALAAFHAEVIDKVGSLIGGMTYGAKKDTGLQLYRTAMELHPDSIIAKTEYANGLLLLEGQGRLSEATRLYELAAGGRALDATEQLEKELARAELAH